MALSLSLSEFNAAMVNNRRGGDLSGIMARKLIPRHWILLPSIIHCDDARKALRPFESFSREYSQALCTFESNFEKFHSPEIELSESLLSDRTLNSMSIWEFIVSGPTHCGVV